MQDGMISPRLSALPLFLPKPTMMPSLSTWVVSAKRQASRTNLINTTPSISQPSRASTASDAITTQGSVYSSTLYSEPDGEYQPNNLSQTSLVSTGTSPESTGIHSASATLDLRRKLGIANARKWSRDSSFNRNTNTEEAVTRLTEENLGLSSQLDAVRSQLASCVTENDNLKDEAKALRTELEDSKSQLERVESDKSALREEVGRLSSDHEESRGRVEALGGQLKASQDQTEDVRRSMAALLDDVEARKRQLSKDVEALEARNTHLNKEVEDLKARHTEAEDAKASMDNAEARIQEATKEVDDARSLLGKKNKLLSKELDDVKGLLGDAARKIKQLGRSVDDLKRKIRETPGSLVIQWWVGISC